MLTKSTALVAMSALSWTLDFLISDQNKHPGSPVSSPNPLVPLGLTSVFRGGVSPESATKIVTASSATVTCRATGTLAPSQGVSVIATYATGLGVWEYSSTVTVFLKDNTRYTYSESGTLTNIAFNECSTRLESSDNPEISSVSSSSSLDPVPSSSRL